LEDNNSIDLPDQKGSFRVLYDNSQYIVVDKPAGVLSIPGRFDDPHKNLVAYLNSYYNKVYVVHRLDRDTSGIMLFALNAETHKALSKLFEKQEIEKIYHAVLDGEPTDDYDIDIPLTSDPSHKGRSMPSGMGKPSLTRMKVIERYGRASLVKCSLVSGRHHQLRVHVASIGNPLLVDPLYGNRSEFFLSEFKKKYNIKKNTEEKPLISRITMHATSLEFIDPITGSNVYYESKWPKDFKALNKQLEKLQSRY